MAAKMSSSRGPTMTTGNDDEEEETSKRGEGKPISLAMEEDKVKSTEEREEICMASIWCQQIAPSRKRTRLFHLSLLITGMLQLLSGTEALKVTVSIPELVKLNDPFWLNCSHQQQQRPNTKEEIYAIKWYKDNEEFYRFLPNAHPKVSIYETNGIQLDTRSHEGNVLVSKADVNSEGLYRCEIIAEAPLFETVAKSRHLRVYALPVRGPRIEILDQQGRPKSLKQADISYAVGDRIELRCNSAPSKPAARLRWYLNEHELQVPQSPWNLTSTSSTAAALTRIKRKSLQQQPILHVGPVELRQHYKNIYSSHSTLSLVLQQDDLINNKISFKCLASMRQPVALRSKQLIVLTPTPATASVASLTSLAPLARRRRQLEGDGNEDWAGKEIEGQAEEASGRQRPHHHRHSISRLSSGGISSKPQDRITELLANQRQQLLYIYEDADSTLGPNIVDSAQSLENYLQSADYNNLSGSLQMLQEGQTNNEFNRATDNLELVQLIRERQARHRSIVAQQSTGGAGQTTSPAGGHNLKRLHGSNFLFKSPLYLDEHDPLRPVISWPPLDSGRLFLLDGGGGSALVALPTRRNQLEPAEARLVLPPGRVVPMTPMILDHLHQDNAYANLLEPLIERLISSLNCTCTEGSSETKMSWLVNETPLEPRNIRFHSPKVSPDHRQTWLTIGLQLSPPNTLDSRFAPSLAPSSSNDFSQSLQSILGHYFQKAAASSLPIASKQTNSPSGRQAAENNQIKFTCQALHSMLLYSSSEIITFDFNPPSPYEGGPSVPPNNNHNNNVIQATSASQSSSAQASTKNLIAASRSQANTNFALFTLSILPILLLESLHGRLIVTRE